MAACDEEVTKLSSKVEVIANRPLQNRQMVTPNKEVTKPNNKVEVIDSTTIMEQIDGCF